MTIGLLLGLWCGAGIGAWLVPISWDSSKIDRDDLLWLLAAIVGGPLFAIAFAHYLGEDLARRALAHYLGEDLARRNARRKR